MQSFFFLVGAETNIGLSLVVLHLECIYYTSTAHWLRWNSQRNIVSSRLIIIRRSHYTEQHNKTRNNNQPERVRGREMTRKACRKHPIHVCCLLTILRCDHSGVVFENLRLQANFYVNRPHI